ncbi:polyprenyl synthetase family protein [Pseudovibrio sp. Tun.PSC04-5.I4]|uniref:polyprenyl synthetase family protein n=1 Tax=Pseudovibrio sp. Tun.PSC04-5.I4 TaxID=1798213 RepID=UPI000888DD37|nr:polyprenyl synthetase family protein [Pseudovibrio sp. Tun.PSC04-5.I4]SDR37738.1 octaprenyl-diphosphate synthase [Pseudovibrio sp. Tun.PSC04-5.I4]
MGVVGLQSQTAKAAGIQGLVELVSGDMEKVNELILSKAGSNVELIPEIARHLIDSGGKRLRPMLTLAFAQMFGYQGEGHVILAASVEFMHTATLLHDDVVDESDMRRGKLAARKLWGNQASVLVGDYLLGQAFKMMVDVGSLEALRILADASAIIAEGEVLQLGAAQDTGTTYEMYLRVIEAKTAALFAAACEVSPEIAGESDDVRAAARKFGLELGYAFQLVDDALDYGGATVDLGKDIGDDFQEGKITLPIIYALQRGSDEDLAFWKRCLEEGDIKDGDLDHAIKLLGETGALADTVQKARDYGSSAIEALSVFPDGPAKQALKEAVDFCIARVS